MIYPRIRLDKVCRITMGQAPSGDSYNFDSEGLALIAGAGDFGKQTPEPKKFTTAAGKKSEKGEIILCIRATIGDLNWSDKEYCLGRGVAGLFGHKDKLDQKYLWYWLTNVAPILKSKGKGATFLQVTKEDICSLEITLPPLSEQRRIASILDKAHDLRQKRQQAIEKLDQLLQATFIDMFGDPVSNPKGFDLVNLESILAKKLISGAYFPKETYTDVGGTPMVHMGDVFYGVVKPNNLKQVKINNEEIEKYRVTNNDLLIARRSLTYEGAAKACRIECFDQHMIFESSLIRLSPNLLKILPEFLYHYLNNSDVRNNFIIPYITKSTISGINQANLNKVKVLLPPLAKQEKFIEICDKFKQLGKKLTDDLNKLDELFKSLQNQAFSGNL